MKLIVNLGAKALDLAAEAYDNIGEDWWDDYDDPSALQTVVEFTKRSIVIYPDRHPDWFVVVERMTGGLIEYNLYQVSDDGHRRTNFGRHTGARINAALEDQSELYSAYVHTHNPEGSYEFQHPKWIRYLREKHPELVERWDG